MKIRAKIYLVVAVMAVTAVAIGALALTVVQRYDARLRDYDNVADRAFLGESLNRRITAVVMEARGIYASSNTEAAKPFARQLLGELDRMDDILAKWRPLVPADQKAAFEAVVARSAEFRRFRMETTRLGTTVSPAAAAAQGNNDENRANRRAYQGEIDAVVTADQKALDAIQSDIAVFKSSMITMVLGIGGIGLLLSCALAFYVATTVLSRPIQTITGTMRRLAGGDLEAEVPHADRKDEIGEIAAAVRVFRENAIAIRDRNAEETALREQSADLQSSIAGVVHAAAEGDFGVRIGKRYDDPDLDRFAGSVNQLVASIDEGVRETRRVVAALAERDLTQSMTGDFKGAFAELQANIDEAFAGLRGMVTEIRHGADAIHAQSSELRAASGDLSRRTEQQAAALEESSAAIEEIASAVRNSTTSAQEANGMVREAAEKAAESALTVRDAVEAMERIEQASAEIASIVDVIDEIAFQTNILALNAGVEAARAGETGKGFAVVAQEVRALAQRATDSAKDIRTLIDKAGDEVGIGVRHVRATGERLFDIETRVKAIDTRIRTIATTAGEQSVAIQEVSTAIQHMDQGVQRNAAMVEETSAATVQLEEQATGLAQLVARFRTEARPILVSPDATGHRAPPAVHEMSARLSRAFVGAN